MLKNRWNKIFQLIRELRSIIDFREVLEIAPSLYFSVSVFFSSNLTAWAENLLEPYFETLEAIFTYLGRPGPRSFHTT